MDLAFRYGGRTYSIRDIDLLHVFLGDVLPKKRDVTGMHYLSKMTNALYELTTKLRTSQKILDVKIFKKNNGMRVGESKDSTVFPVSWSLPKCVKKSVEALQNNYQLQIGRAQGNFALMSKTSCGVNIQFIYDPISQNIKSFYPIIELLK